MRLDYMTPILAMDNFVDCPLADSEKLCQLCLSNNKGDIQGSDLKNLFSRKFGLSVLLSFRRPVTTLVNAVLRIVFWSTSKKVSRIATRRIVAFMENFKTFRNWSIGKEGSYSMGHGSIFLFAGWRKSSIAMAACFASPRPTFVWLPFINLSPKLNNLWGSQDHIGGDCSHVADPCNA